MNFRVSRSGSGSFTVNFAVSGTATNGADYATIGASVFMPSNTSPVNVPLTPIEDGAVEGDETVTITLLPGAGYTLGATITITDNETAEYGRLANLQFGSWVNGSGQTVPLRLDLYAPLATPGPWPVVLYIFGGGWSVGARSAVGTRELSLCAKGYAVAAMDYRYAQDAVWPAQIHDIKGSIRWLRARAAQYQLDAARFAVTGTSAGGHLAACVGAMSDVATLDFSGVYGVPMIHNFDNNDGFITPVVLQGQVEYGRAQGAPWTFFIHHDGNHTDNDTALTTLIFPWLAAVLDARLPANAGTGDGTVTLDALPEASGWLGDIKTKAIASFASYAGDKTKAAWFPNQSVATFWNGYHVAPPYSIPAQPIVAPSGIIADLTILDPLNNDTTSGTGWKINANFKEADQAGSLVKVFIMAPPPASVAGLDWIRPITPGKNYTAYTADPIFNFRVTADATVFIAHSDAATSRPAWLATYTNTGEQLVVTAGNLTATAPRYTLFKKDFAANATVTCGTNNPAPSGQMYLTLVKPLGAPALPSVSVNASDASATEGGDTGALTISRTGETTAALTVNFTMSGSATGGTDYASLGTSIVIPAGLSSVALAVTPIEETLVEGTETVTLSLSRSATYALGVITTASVNITDNDTSSLPIVTVVASDADAGEPSNGGAWTVTRTGSTTSALTATFSTSGTAPRAVDYTLTGPTGTTLTIPAGQASRTITLNVTNDALVESTETATCSISANAAYTLGSPASATISITDNDGGGDPWLQQPAISYATRGTRDLQLDIFLPRNPLPGLIPVVIYIPGGGWSTVSRGSIGDNFKGLTADGFAVVSIDHTNSGDAIWPAQIQDCKAAVRWLRANAATYNFDPAHFAVTGISSGGHMSAMIGTTGGVSSTTIGSTTVDFVGANPTNPTQSDAVQAAIPIMPPTHLLWADHFFSASVPDKNGPTSPQSRLVGAPLQTVPELTATAIPMTFIAADAPPFLITNGTNDASVTFNASELLNAALVRAGRSSTFWATVNGAHDASTTASTENTLLIRQFLRRTLLGDTANALPVASFTASVASGPAPLTVSFNGSTSTDSDGSVTKYAWSFGENDGANGATASFTYTTPGLYPVTLAVRDNLGAAVSITQFVTVLASTPASGTPPSVALASPAEGLLILRPAFALAQANASDADGTIRVVKFILDGQSAGFDRATSFLSPWGHLAAGAHTVAVRGYDDAGNVTLTPTPTTFWVADTGNFVTLTDAGDYPALQYLRSVSGTAQVEASGDLVSWANAAVTTQVLPTNPLWQLLKSTDTVPISATPRRFYRVKTTTP